MGLFWDKLKAMFKKKTDVEFAEPHIYKQSSAPAQLVAVGFGKDYDNTLSIRKTKSQAKNWKRWRRK